MTKLLDVEYLLIKIIMLLRLSQAKTNMKKVALLKKGN